VSEGPRVRLQPGQTAVVGYGSLLSRPSVEKTLERKYDGYFGACTVAGWRRSWDAGMPNLAFYFRQGTETIYPLSILYLNVRLQTGSDLNGILFVLEAHELEAMHNREWIYEPRVVTSQLREVTIDGGDAVMYVVRPHFRVTDPKTPRDAAIRLSYLRIVQFGLAQTDDAFREAFERSTDPLPSHLVINDELDPTRPSSWARAGTRYRP
jgi:cation transport regulator ChaC